MAKPLCFFYFFLCSIGFSQTENFTVKNSEINTEYPHFGLMLVANSKIIFTSYLLDKKDRVERIQGHPILAIFEGEIDVDGAIQNIKNIEIDPDQKINYITSASMSSNGKQLYITTTFDDRNFDEDNFQIKVGEFKSGIGWTNFEVLPFCDSKYSYAHPALSKDGKTLYFTSNIRGGKETTKGGSDIFKVDILENGKFSEPKNLGSKVNSYSKEMFPFITGDNTLYFASNRPNGFGGFDIYKSQMSADGTFEKAEKLPKPINSPKDDFSFIIKNDRKTGYFTSKRDDGKGDDDIYYFSLN
ncbi:PD40 domain-containing protein [Mariniflexile gromovii]|uniref:PD40 domain-containing protein n=1 Tax=Mariniflexile gromovii TaxID=362523 RepID=A0ABS4BRU7_9FLAO|nr:PD40 domain-containing protein [Mariniflexile gromovii]MBP0903304.1 PD40 domain-containing protein [Mariniflexile gromovii]